MHELKSCLKPVPQIYVISQDFHWYPSTPAIYVSANPGTSRDFSWYPCLLCQVYPVPYPTDTGDIMGLSPDVPQHYVCVPGPLSLTDTGDISGLSADVFQHLLCMCPRSNLVPQIEGTSRDFLLMSLNTSLLCSYVSHAGPTSPTDTGDISGLSLMSLTLPCYVCVPGPTRPTDTGDISRLSPDVPNTYLLCMLLTSTGTRITRDFPLIIIL